MVHKIQILLVVICVPILLLFMYLYTTGASFNNLFEDGVPIVRIGEVPLRVHIADSSTERMKGLSDLEAFPTDIDGLLFVFDTPGIEGIWMKDMHFPIDVIWIGEDLTVVDVTRGLRPDSYPKIYRPVRPVKYVIETDVHYTEIRDIHVGQPVTLPQGY